MPAAPFRTGRIAIVGRPNVGKSTLLNALVDEHVSITSNKPQTTRTHVLGIVSRDDAQYVFVDTPGFQDRHRSGLTRSMNGAVRAALRDVDAIVLVIDALAGWTPEDERVLALLPKPRGPGEVDGDGSGGVISTSTVVLAANKIDRLKDRDRLLPLMAASAERHPFAAIVPISAERGRQLDDLLAALRPLLPPGEAGYDADLYTDRSVRFLAAELIREKAFRLLGDELPYGLAVSIESWHEDRALAIAATLWVERESQRAIVIGAGGAKLREIGRLARLDIARLVERPVHLATHVRIRRGWSNDLRALGELGYE
jgi:GTP-binding protein Era